MTKKTRRDKVKEGGDPLTPAHLVREHHEKGQEALINIAKVDLVAFDPGKNTGVAMVRDGVLVDSWTIEISDLVRLMAHEESPCKEWIACKTWVVEDFRLYPWMSEQMAFDSVVPAQIIGSLRVLATRHGINMHMQNAGAVKQFVTKAMLKRQQWQPKGAHEKDAARHALYYLVKAHNRGIR